MDDIVQHTERRASDLTALLERELAALRTNRPAPQLIEDIGVSYAGQTLAVKQLGSISVVLPRELQVHVWDSAAVQGVLKAIEAAGIGVQPFAQGSVVRVVLPAMSDERRTELKRLAKALAEKLRIQLRALRDESNKGIELAFKAKEIGEDRKFALRSEVQQAIDDANARMAELIDLKTNEIDR